MSLKAKGNRAERELLDMFWNNSFAGFRAPGSGSTPLPSPDLLVGNGKRYLAIECKVIGNTNKFFSEEDIQQLLKFSDKFGAEPWIAIKSDYKGWFFLKREDTDRTKNGYYSISLELAKQKGLNLNTFLQLQ